MNIIHGCCSDDNDDTRYTLIIASNSLYIQYTNIQFSSILIKAYIDTHTNIHTHIYIYIYKLEQYIVPKYKASISIYI